MRECDAKGGSKISTSILPTISQCTFVALLIHAGLQVQSIFSAGAGKPCERAGTAKNAIFLPCENVKTIQSHCSVCQVTKETF